jgi:hypothetical protein
MRLPNLALLSELVGSIPADDRAMAALVRHVVLMRADTHHINRRAPVHNRSGEGSGSTIAAHWCGAICTSYSKCAGQVVAIGAPVRSGREGGRGWCGKEMSSRGVRPVCTIHVQRTHHA